MKTRYGEDCAGSFQELALRPAAAGRRRHHHVLSRRPHPRLGAGADGAAGPAHRRHRRLQAPARPHGAAVRAGAMRPARHRGDLRPAGVPASRSASPRSARLLKSVREHPERAHVIGCYALGKAQRVISLLRQAGYDEPIYLHGAMIALCDLYEERGIPLGTLVHSLEMTKAELAGQDRHRAAAAPSRTAGAGGCPTRCSPSPRAG